MPERLRSSTVLGVLDLGAESNTHASYGSGEVGELSVVSTCHSESWSTPTRGVRLSRKKFAHEARYARWRSLRQDRCVTPGS